MTPRDPAAGLDEPGFRDSLGYHSYSDPWREQRYWATGGGGDLSRPTRGGDMDQARARARLAAERARLLRLLQADIGRPEAAEVGDAVDDADRRNAEETGMAVDQLLRARWAALQRAEARLAAGTYGRSVVSGQAIPDERLEADPLAELTVEEAAAAEPGHPPRA